MIVILLYIVEMFLIYKFITGKDLGRLILYWTFLIRGGEGGVEPQTKFSKRERLDRTSAFRGGLLVKRGWLFFWGGLQFSHKTGFGIWKTRACNNHMSCHEIQAIDVQKIACHQPSRCMMTCNDYSF